MKIQIYDTTLRDGTQSKDVNLTVYDKLKLVEELDNIKVDYIELGWPGSNPKDMESFLEASKLRLNHAKLAAFGSTRRKGVKASEDSNLQAILKSKALIATLFGKTIKEHVFKQLGMTTDENLNAISESVEFLKKNGLKVFYDAEHFFDGYKDDKSYALECLKTAYKAGADCLILCDTNGGCLPHEITQICNETMSFLKENNINAPVGAHVHNDSGCGVANTLAAVNEGITHVQACINGVGERCGNADLCQVIPNLVLKLGLETNVVLKELSNISSTFNTLANIKSDNNRPYVGRNSFSHKGGIHVDAVMKGASYEHIDPSLVGNKRDIVLSDLSGKANIVEVAKGFGIEIDKNDPKVKEMLKDVEELEKKGYNIGGIRAEHKLLVNKHINGKEDAIKIDTWKIMSEFRGEEFSECVLTGTIDGKKREVVAPVNAGPVNATFHALRKMVATRYKKIDDVRLLNYKVMIAEDKGPASSVRVYIEFGNGGKSWATIGVSTNILEASLESIKKAFLYHLDR